MGNGVSHPQYSTVEAALADGKSQKEIDGFIKVGHPSGETKESDNSVLRVKPGIRTLHKAYKKVKQNYSHGDRSIKTIMLLAGVHEEGGTLQHKGHQSMSTIVIDIPITIVGEGPDLTFVEVNFYITGDRYNRTITETRKDEKFKGYGILIRTGKKKDGKFILKNLTVRKAGDVGLCGMALQSSRERKIEVITSGPLCNLAEFDVERSKKFYNEHQGMHIDCINTHFTECSAGVLAWNTTIRLIDCKVTNCEMGGITTQHHGLIELLGEKTKISGNCCGSTGTGYIEENGDCPQNSNRDYYWEGDYGMHACFPSSKIVIHLPLTKELVSTNNAADTNSKYGNWGGKGTINGQRIKKWYEEIDGLDDPNTVLISSREPNSDFLNRYQTLKLGLKRAKKKGWTSVYLEAGVHNGDENCREGTVVDFPVTIIGAGNDQTYFEGTITILGKKEDGKEVTMKEMTIRNDQTFRKEMTGLSGVEGMHFTCINMNFTKCGNFGVSAFNTNCKLIDCQVTECGNSGIFSNGNGLIELFGEKTKVSGNCTEENACSCDHYGLNAFVPESKIILHSPLTKELVSTDNGGGGNWGGSYLSAGTINGERLPDKPVKTLVDEETEAEEKKVPEGTEIILGDDQTYPSKSEIEQGDLLITCSANQSSSKLARSSVPDGIWKKLSIVHNERPVYMYNGTAAVELIHEDYVHDVFGGKEAGERYLYYTSPSGRLGCGWLFSLKTPEDDSLTENGCAAFSGINFFTEEEVWVYKDFLTPDLIEGEWYQNQLTGRPLGVVSITKARE